MIKKIYNYFGLLLFSEIVVTIISIFCPFVLLVLGNIYQKQTATPAPSGFSTLEANPFLPSNFSSLYANGILLVFVTFAVLSLVTIVIGIIRLILARKDKQKKQHALHLLVHGIGGFLYIFLVYFILNVILANFGISNLPCDSKCNF